MILEILSFITFPVLCRRCTFQPSFLQKIQAVGLEADFHSHTTQFIETLIQSVMDRRQNPNIDYKGLTSSLALPQPALPANIAPAPKPPKEAAASVFKSHFWEWHLPMARYQSSLWLYFCSNAVNIGLYFCLFFFLLCYLIFIMFICT